MNVCWTMLSPGLWNSKCTPAASSHQCLEDTICPAGSIRTLIESAEHPANRLSASCEGFDHEMLPRQCQGFLWIRCLTVDHKQTLLTCIGIWTSTRVLAASLLCKAFIFWQELRTKRESQVDQDRATLTREWGIWLAFSISILMILISSSFNFIFVAIFLSLSLLVIVFLSFHMPSPK